MNLIFIVHCQWESWESWSPCTKTCEGGSQRRTRIIKVQTPYFPWIWRGEKLCEFDVFTRFFSVTAFLQVVLKPEYFGDFSQDKRRQFWSIFCWLCLAFKTDIFLTSFFILFCSPKPTENYKATSYGRVAFSSQRVLSSIGNSQALEVLLDYRHFDCHWIKKATWKKQSFLLRL